MLSLIHICIEIGVGRINGKFALPLGIKLGIEPSFEMRKIAESRGIRVIDGVAENLPLEDESFELVLMAVSYTHLDVYKRQLIYISILILTATSIASSVMDNRSVRLIYILQSVVQAIQSLRISYNCIRI